MTARQRPLVVGASGLSGGALVAALLEDGADVWATVRSRSRGGTWERHRDAVHLAYADVLDLSSLLRVLRQASPTHVYYLAGAVSVAYTESVPITTYQTNVLGWAHMLEALRLWGEKPRVVWVGSGDQYGRSAVDHCPLREDAPFRPTTAYAASKCAQDAAAYQYFDQWGLPVVRARTFHVAGAGQAESYACASFAAQVARVEAGRHTSVRVGNLEAQRDYLDIRDAARAYVMLAERGRPGEAYNVCSGRTTSLEAILETLKGLATCPVPVEPDPSRMRPSPVPRVLGSHEKITAETGWVPRRSLDTTLHEMLEEARRSLAGA